MDIYESLEVSSDIEVVRGVYGYWSKFPINTGFYIWAPIIIRGPIYISPILGTVI